MWCSAVLDHIVERARQQQIFCRDPTAIEQRILRAFLYHAGQSYQKITRFVDRSHVVIHDWYHRLASLFELASGHHDVVAIDETELFVEDREVYV